MKRINYFFLVGLLFFTQISLCQNIKITEKAINKKALLIKQMMVRHNYVVSCLTALGYLQQLSYWLPSIIAGGEYLFGEEKVHVPTVVCQKASEQQSLGFVEGMWEGTKNLFCTESGLKSIVGAAFTLGSHIGALFLFQKISDTVYHPDTLRWYIYSKVPYNKTVAIIEDLAKKVSADNLTQEQVCHYRFFLFASCKQLVNYGEDLCAYMTYKSFELLKNQKMLAESASRYLLNYQNEVFEAIFAELDSNKPDYDRIISFMKSYSIELKYQRKLFAAVEGETKEELRLFSSHI